MRFFPKISLVGLSALLIFLTFDLMLLGAGVRAMDAGLACPDWPLCFGRVIPDFHLGVWLEFLHRVIAGLVFLLFVAFWVGLYRSYSRDGLLKFWAAFGFLLLVAQVLMGALTVLKLLEPGIVTTHLALATIFLGILYLMKKRLEEHEGGWADEKSRPISWVLLLPVLAVFGQLLLGGAVASTYSGKVCLDFPKCLGQWVPTLEGQIGLQVIHRFGAYGLFLVSVLFFVFANFSKWGAETLSPRIRHLSKIFLGLVVVQILVGIMSLKLLIPAWMSVLHLAMAVLLFRVTLEMAYWGLRGGPSKV